MFLELSGNEFLEKLKAYAKPKTRSYDTHHDIHIPELNLRLHPNEDSPLSPQQHAPSNDTSPQEALTPSLNNISPIHAVYLGNSMLERLKTIGHTTNLTALSSAFNAGVGGDKNENVIYRLTQGLYSILKTGQSNASCDIKLWVLTSGTNNFHPKGKRPFGKHDIESWRMLVEACLRISLGSTVLACDISYRLDVLDEVLEESNEMLKGVVGDVNRELRERDVDGKERVKWVESRHLIGKDMLDDHVHFNEEGYRVWDGVVWPLVGELLGIQDSGKEDEKTAEGNS